MARRLLDCGSVVMRHLSCVVIFLFATALQAAAQSAGKIAVGASLGTRFAPSSAVAGDDLGVGFLWRLGHSKEGFGLEWGLNWFSSNVDHSFGGTPAFE